MNKCYIDGEILMWHQASKHAQYQECFIQKFWEVWPKPSPLDTIEIYLLVSEDD